MNDEFHPSEFKQKFIDSLNSGELRTVNATTHPFALSEDVTLCTRCGVKCDDDTALYQSVAFVDAMSTDGKEITVRPFLLMECGACAALESAEKDLNLYAHA